VSEANTNTNQLDTMSRDELIARAHELSINRPELMTRVELRDEIIRLTETDEEHRKRARGWLGVARDLVASVVEQRLNLPDAAELIRGANLGASRHVPPVATVTLAEIYAAQGHLGRAIKLLDEVLEREPEHAAATALRMRLIELQATSKAEPAVRQSDLPEPLGAEWRDLAQPESFAAESSESDALEIEPDPGESDTAEAEAIAAVEEENDAQATGIGPVNDMQVSAVVATAEPQPEPVVPDLALETCGEVLLYRRSASTVVCHWALGADTWEEWRAHRDGEWVVRVFQAKAVDGPLGCEETDVTLPGISGEALFDVDQRTHVRMAVGWKSADHFHPVAIGVEVTGETREQLQVAWAPLPSVDDPAPEFWLRHASRYWTALSASDA
jgi:hypothetical protein